VKEMDKLEKLLFLTGVTYILADTYKEYPLTDKEAKEVSRLTAIEYGADYENVTEDDAIRIMDHLLATVAILKKELLEEEKNDNPLPISE
jgi:protein-disulfide isomerase-like protein with CxxC motif